MEELKQRIRILEDRINELSLRNNQVTFLDTLSQKLIGDLVSTAITNDVVVSTKSATSENQGVNESGSASYYVLAPPDAFLQVTHANKTVYYIPVYL